MSDNTESQLPEDFFTVGDESPLYVPGANNTIRRFWMKAGTKARVLFLTNEAITFYEHQGLPNGMSKWPQALTCVTPLKKPCPLCNFVNKYPDMGKFRAKKCRALSIINLTEWKDKAGNIHKDEKQLFIVNSNKVDEMLGIAKMTAVAQGKSSFRGLIVDIMRTSEATSPNVGSAFIPMDWRELGNDEQFKELDYRDILKPNPEKLQEVANILELQKQATPITEQKPINYN